MNKMKNNVVAGVVRQSVAALVAFGLAFGLAACGDDSSSNPMELNGDGVEDDAGSSSSGSDNSSASEDESSSSDVVSLTGAYFATDYKSGELRWIDKDGKISGKSISFYQDSKLIANGGDLYVLERMGADNISLWDPEKLDDGAKEAVLWQVSLDDGANPTDMAFDGTKAWVALQNADSLIQVSTEDGKISKSIKTSAFSAKGETSPYVADIELRDGNLYVLMQRYTYDAENWVTTYPKGLVAVYDASSGELKDTIQLATKNPTAMSFFDGVLYVATQGEYNESYGTDADENRGIEKVDLDKKTSKLFVSGEKLGGGIYAFVSEGNVAYAAVYKSYGDVPLAKVNLESGDIKMVKDIADAEGSIAVKGGVVYVGDRSYGTETVYVVGDDKAEALEIPEGAIAPYSIVLF